MVVNWRPLTRNPLPNVPGLLGLIVATSKTGSASAAIGFSRAGGGGMVHAVSGVTCFRFNGSGRSPWVKFPAIEIPSESSFPSYDPPMPGITILTVEPCRVTELIGIP